jgi:hypothetical protein
MEGPTRSSWLACSSDHVILYSQPPEDNLLLNDPVAQARKPGYHVVGMSALRVYHELAIDP